MIIGPDKLLMVVDKDDLRIFKSALKDWKGPCPDGARTPTEVEYEKKARERARVLRAMLGKYLGNGSVG